MKLSLNWLKDYVNITVSPEKLAERLLLSGTAVDSIEYEEEKYKNIVVGEIKEIKPHKNADKLRLAYVFDGHTTRTIVCGAPNIAPLQMVPLALPQARLQNGLTISSTNIRGQVSDGMLCSPKELGLGDDHSGILILDSKIKAGTALSRALLLNDVIFELALTPNRGDCFSVIGIAREVVAITNSKLKIKNAKLQLQVQNFSPLLKVAVEEKKLCPKYCAVVIKGVEVSDSPYWLKRRLESVGIRSINNIVDITNFIMLSTGEPIHAFDAQKVNGCLVVRKAKNNEKILTLDEKIRALDESMLIIADHDKPIGIAGIMGGKESEVSINTKDIIIEAAIFDPVIIRSAHRKLGLPTDAAIRFEKGIDWYMVEQALTKAAFMVQELAGGKISSPIIRVASPNPPKVSFNLDLSYINTLLGHKFALREVRAILKRLGIESIAKKQGSFYVNIPSWRNDVRIPADIAEEVGRLFDYNKFEPKPLCGDINIPKPNEFFTFKEKLKEKLQGLGFNEVYTYSFYSVNDAEIVGGEHIEVENPINKEQRFLRKSLAPLLLRAASSNLRFFDEVKVFEVGTVFIPTLSREALPQEETHLCAFVSYKDMRELEFYRKVKGELELMLGHDFLIEKTDKDLSFKFQGRTVGALNFLSKKYRDLYKIRGEGLFFWLNLSRLKFENIEQKKYSPIPTYPSSKRDFSFFVPKGVKYQNLLKPTLKQSPYIENIELIDEYYHEKLGRSITIRLTFRSSQKTLETDEIDAIQKKVIEALNKLYGLTLRQ